MKRRWPAIVAVSALAACLAGGGAVAAVSGAVPAAGSWGRAIEVPGLGALNTGRFAEVSSVSCASPGNCAAGGFYDTGRRDHSQGFVVSEKNGRWGRAIEVPGLGALNKGRNASVNSVSCASPGNCAAGGDYTDRRIHLQGFVAVERHGVWRPAIEVPGLGALNTGGYAEVDSVSCAAPGNCAAGGSDQGRNENDQGFVVSERNGRWGRAIKVGGGSESINSVSCASPGNCAAASVSGSDGLVVSETNGTWGPAIQVPGPGGGNAGLDSVSCAAPGNCAAGGGYLDQHFNGQGLVVTETNGVWGPAIEVPGLGALNGGGEAGVNEVSCASPGNCAAGGDYLDGSSRSEGFVVSEQNGTWGQAIQVPGLGRLNTGGVADLNTVSCASPGNCAAGGDYADRRFKGQGFVVSETNGTWGQAIEVPGLGRLNTGGQAAVNSVSCAAPGSCAAGGNYAKETSRHSQGFVT